MMSKKSKPSKSGAKKSSKKYDSDSDSSSSGSYTSSSESSSCDSAAERVRVKRPKLDSSSKKRKRRDEKRREKRKKSKAANKISKDDFFGKSIEFRLWLMEEKKLSMGDMKTSKAKTFFKKFVKKWNEGKLAKKYYKGIDAADAKGSLTKYKWKFAETAQGADLKGLSGTGDGPIASGVRSSPPRATFSTFGKSSLPEIAASSTIGPEKPVLGPQRPPHLIAQQDSDEDREAERSRVRAERRNYREYDKLTNEELAPRATGHQAKIEKKLLRKQRAHSPEVSDQVLMGSGMDYEKMMAKKRRSDASRRDRNAAKASVKLMEYQTKESAKMKALFEMAKATKSKDALW